MLIGACAGIAAEPVRVTDQRTLASAALPRVQNASHALTLHVYRFTGTRWREDDIVAAVPAAASLLAQCGVAVERAEIALVEAPRQFRIYHTPISRELARRLDVRKPALFFVDDTHNQPAFDAEAIGLSNAARRPELANTMWVAYGTRDLAHAIAHELVHLLSDSGEHSGEPGNLMQIETSPRNTALSPAQCQRMVSRGEANGLLARVMK